MAVVVGTASPVVTTVTARRAASPSTARCRRETGTDTGGVPGIRRRAHHEPAAAAAPAPTTALAVPATTMRSKVSRTKETSRLIAQGPGTRANTSQQPPSTVPPKRATVASKHIRNELR